MSGNCPRSQLKETGLGTPATRAAVTIEVLLKRGLQLVPIAEKNLEATDKGIHLIDVVHPEVKSPAMTGQWEAFLKKIQQGESRLEPFLGGISDIRSLSLSSKVGQTTPSIPGAKAADSPKSLASRVPEDAKQFSAFATLTERFFRLRSGFSAAFRPNQEAVCEAVTAGKKMPCS